MAIIQPGVRIVDSDGKLYQPGISNFPLIQQQIDPSTIVIDYRNLFDFTEIYAKSITLKGTAAIQTIINNPYSSNTIYKINTLLLTNTDDWLPCDATVELFRDPARIYNTKTTTIYARQTFIIVDSENSFYLGQGESLRCFASADNQIDVICSYEEMS